ncbi:MAG: RES family NAD+ phosphorylase [Terriglobales bacterium]
MKAWRICRAIHAAGAFSGDGARLYGGRWNSQGVRIVYASSSLALAAVETFVHFEPNLRPDDLVSIEVEIPDRLATERIDPHSLPRRWYELRDDSLRAIGDRWVRSGKTVALHVPSAAIRREWNVLLNPEHAEFRKLRIEKPKAFEFDLRMFR